MSKLRPAEGADLERIVELFLELGAYNVALGQRRPLRWSEDPTDFARDRYSDALASPSDHRVTVSLDQHGEVVGVCHTNLTGEGHPCAAHVQMLIVDEKHRGQGLGRALLDDAFQWCAEVGVDEVSLDVASRSRDSRRFYERYGFEEATVLVVKRVE
jgi:ribosomal protein S18 acetylase RimI-like enzyme